MARCAEREKVVVVPWGLARGDDDELQHNKLGLFDRLVLMDPNMLITR